MSSNDPPQQPSIRCKPNGPYLVKALAMLTNSRGEAIAAAETIALCRCGGSSKKPFCDGTHAKIGFEDAKQAERSKDKRKSYAGKSITIHDNRGLCAHAGVCTTRLSAVWRIGGNPWIDPDAASAKAIMQTIEACPSGALSYSIGGQERRDSDRPGAIRLAKDGPYMVSGNIELEGVEFGAGASREHYTLCRCGASKNKPFCDGSHYDVGFEHKED